MQIILKKIYIYIKNFYFQNKKIKKRNMNKFNTKIIYPLVGSIGLTAYLFDNNKYVNFKLFLKRS